MAVADRMVTEDPASKRPVVRASVLGCFEVRVGDRNVAHADWQRVSAERLVKLLLVTRGHTMSRETAAETLWPGMEPATGMATLRKALHYARRALDVTGLPESDGRSVSLGLHVDADLDRLLAAFAVVESPHDSGQGSGAVETILELGAEDLLPDDVYEDWLAGPRERLRSRWQQVALVAAKEAGERGDTARSHALLDQILERDATDEAAHRLVIALYARDGRHHAARRQFVLCREALRRELEVEPSPETVAALEAAEAVAGAAPATDREPRLIARRQELERIEPLLDRVAAGRFAGLVLRGSTGIGKSRLLREVAAYAEAAGWRVPSWQATDATRPNAFAQATAALGALATAEEIASWDEPGRSAASWLRTSAEVAGAIPFSTQEALLAGLVSAFDSATRMGPVMLVVDDLPWLDDGSLDVLRRLAGGASNRPLFVAATGRDDDAWPPGAVAFVDDVRHAGGLELTVGPLGQKDVEPLVVAHLGGSSVQPEVVRDVFQESAGNPLFCLEIVQTARDRGSLRLEAGRWNAVTGVPVEGLPPTVQRLVASRSESLATDTVELLATAAELGTAWTYPTLAAVLARPGAEVMRLLDEALDSGLLVERGDGYAFAHPLYRRAVVERRRAPRRAATRLAIARALAGTGAGTGDGSALAVVAARHSDPVPVAENALGAASAGLAKALPLGVAFGFAAGERLFRLFDREAATALLHRSLQAWQRLEPTDAAAFDASRAWRTMADLHRAFGDEKASVASCREAARVARDPVALADAYIGLAQVPYRHGDFEATIAILEEGASRLPDDAEIARARLASEAAWSLARMRRVPEALGQVERAAEVLVALGDRAGSMQALDILGMTLLYAGRREEAVGHLEASLALAVELPDPWWEMRVRTHVGTAHVRGGEAARGRPHLDRARELAILVGDHYGEAVAEWSLGEMEHRLGDWGRAAAHRRREIALLEGLGGNSHNAAMAHAHLAHLARIAHDVDAELMETAAARDLARRSPEPDYAGRVERALAVDDWSQAET
jgi:DNA-binding SARP family transcriptional activator/tetratricopeptide (TPR) repeat protein